MLLRSLYLALLQVPSHLQVGQEHGAVGRMENRTTRVWIRLSQALPWGEVWFGALQFWRKSLECPHLPWATWVAFLGEAKPEALLGIQSKFPPVPDGTTPGCSCGPCSSSKQWRTTRVLSATRALVPLWRGSWLYKASGSIWPCLPSGFLQFCSFLVAVLLCWFKIHFFPFFFCLLPQNYGTSRAVQLRCLLQTAWGDLWIGLCHQSGCSFGLLHLGPLDHPARQLGVVMLPFYKGEEQMFR